MCRLLVLISERPSGVVPVAVLIIPSSGRVDTVGLSIEQGVADVVVVVVVVVVLLGAAGVGVEGAVVVWWSLLYHRGVGCGLRRPQSPPGGRLSY